MSVDPTSMDSQDGMPPIDAEISVPHDPFDSVQVASNSRPPRIQQPPPISQTCLPPRSELLMHWALLLLSLMVLVASRSLSIRNEVSDLPSSAAVQDDAHSGGGSSEESLARDSDDRDAVVLPIFEMRLPGTCTFRNVTGVPCPGCGLTRSFISLAHGQWKSAWQYNPAGWLYFAVLVFQIPYRTWQLARYWRGRQPFRFRRLGDWTLWTLALALLIQWGAALILRAITSSSIPG